jgi:DNA-binding transcriptional ArsR family regulator
MLTISKKMSFKKNVYLCSQYYELMKDKEVITSEQQKAARYAKAMGHPIRMYVLELLSKQNCCYSGDLTEELPIAKSTLSQHLKELKDAGLIQGEIESPKIRYCINNENWAEAQTLFKHFLDL